MNVVIKHFGTDLGCGGFILLQFDSVDVQIWCFGFYNLHSIAIRLDLSMNK